MGTNNKYFTHGASLEKGGSNDTCRCIWYNRHLRGLNSIEGFRYALTADLRSRLFLLYERLTTARITNYYGLEKGVQHVEGTRTIQLVNERGITLVSAADYERVKRYSWQFHKGYAVTRVDGKLIYLHRLIMDAPEGMMVDHINRDRLDNRQVNLRIATNRQNQANVAKRVGTTSRYRGVSKHAPSGRWQARISLEGKQKHLGYYEDEEAAARAYDAKAREVFGSFAEVNFPGLPM